MCELEWPHGVGAAARRSSAGLAIQRCSSRQEAASTPELLRPGQGHPLACSGSADAHQIALLDPRWLPSATGSAGATTCWRRSSANYCQASARRDMIMGARMCAQGTSGLLRDAWLGSASACEFSLIFCTKVTWGSSCEILSKILAALQQAAGFRLLAG